MRAFLAIVFSAVLLAGCDNSSTSGASSDEVLVAPVLDDVQIVTKSGLKPVREYKLDDGRGVYVHESPDAAIEFRSNPPRINIVLRTFPEAEFKDKNEIAYAMAKKLTSVVTGDEKFFENALGGIIKPGRHTVNGLPVNVSAGENDLLITISKQ